MGMRIVGWKSRSGSQTIGYTLLVSGGSLHVRRRRAMVGKCLSEKGEKLERTPAV